MAGVRVKICGITDAADMQAAAAAGADLVGFNFHAASPRALSPERAAQLAAGAPAHLLRVALLVDAADDKIDEAIAAINPHFLQLHGRESPAQLRRLKRRVMPQLIKAISVQRPDDLAQADAYAQAADWLLLDAAAPGAGGAGRAFDWRWLSDYAPPCPWLLAGGLTADNVAQAVRVTRAPMVDVASGVEDAPGRKSASKMRRFVAAAKGHIQDPTAKETRHG